MLCYSIVALYLANNELEGIIPNEIGEELTKLSECYHDCYRCHPYHDSNGPF
jgi:hypothetical protein